MGQTLVKDVLYRASVLAQDVEPQFTRWPEREMVTWLNDGQRAIYKYLPMAGSRVDAVKLAPGTRQHIGKILAANIVPGDGSTPADVAGQFLFDVIRNMGADGLTPGKPIRVISREVLDTQTAGWHSAEVAGGVRQYVFDPRTPKVFYVSPPVPATPAQWVEIAYLAQPVNVPNTGTPSAPAYAMDGSSTVTITIDDQYIDDLVNYIVARAYSKDAEFSAKGELAVAYTNMFLQSLNAQVQALTGKSPNIKMLPLAAEIQAGTA